MKNKHILANFDVVSPQKIRNPFYADYNPISANLNMDSLDKFKKEYQSQPNLKVPQLGYQENYDQFQNRNIQNENDSNELAKNLANFYGVTPPRTG